MSDRKEYAVVIPKWSRFGVLFLAMFAPAVAYFVLHPMSEITTSAGTVFNSLSQLSGLVGMALFLASILTSLRTRAVDKAFGGLNYLYRFHHTLGVVSFGLLLLHPLFSCVKLLYVYPTHQAIAMALPGATPSITYGWAALVVMMAILVPTIYFRPKYHRWKLMHTFFGLTLVFGVTHIYYVGGEVTRHPLLRWVCGAVLVWAALSFVWFTVFRRRQQARFRVVSVEPSSGKRLLAIGLEPVGPAMAYEPGQYAFFKFFQPGISRESHPFSYSSHPTEKVTTLVVKNLGDYTSRLFALRPGATAAVEGPYGTFCYKRATRKRQIWIAGGIGVSPFIPMAKDLLLNNDAEYRVDLYDASNSRAEAFGLEELNRVAEASGGRFRVFFWPLDEKGFLTVQAIGELSGGYDDKDVFLCGPPAMMSRMREQLELAGVAADRLHAEDFDY